MTQARARLVARWGRAAAAAILLGVGLGCPEKPLGPGGGTPLRSIIVAPDTATVAVDGMQALTAYGLNSAGDTLTGITFYWSAATPTTASVSSSTGLVTGVAVGSTQIAASAQGISGYATVNVTAKPIASVTVYPAGVTLRIATIFQLTDTIRDISGAVVHAQAAWTSSSASIASVDQTGLVTARALGTDTITASYGNKHGTSIVTVSQVPVASVVWTSAPPALYIGQTTNVSAMAEDSIGDPLPGRVIRYHSGNTAVATVDSVAGIVVGVAAGTAQLTATSEGVTSAPLTVTVTAAPPSTVVLSPSVSQVHVGATVTLSATVTNSQGMIIPNPTVTFTSSNTNIASVTTPPGATAQVLAGPQTGTATITGTDGTATGTATIIVSLVGVDSVHVSATQDTLTVGGATATLTATPYDSSGNVLTGRTATWNSSLTSVATVSSTGPTTALVTPRGPGTVVMFAMVNGVTGSLAMVVNQVPVATCIVVPQADTILPLGQVQLADTLKDANGNVLTGRTVTWLSGNNAIATVSSTGLVTGIAAGSVQISCTSGSAVGYNTTLVLAPVQTVIVAPPSQTITTAQTAQFTDTLKDANGIVLTGRAVTWSSSDTAIHVSQTGLVTPTSQTDTATNVTITVTVNQPTGARSGTAAVTVTLVPVATVVVYPGSNTIWATAPLNTIQLNDSTKDASGNNLTNRPVTWTWSPTTPPPLGAPYATASASGLVTATNNAAGTETITATATGGANGSATVIVLGHTQTVTTNFSSLPSDTLSASGTLTPPYINSTNITVQVLDSFGTDVTASRTITWINTDPSTIRVQFLGAGLYNIAAISMNSPTVTLTASVTDPGPLTVNSAPTTITIVP